MGTAFKWQVVGDHVGRHLYGMAEGAVAIMCVDSIHYLQKCKRFISTTCKSINRADLLRSSQAHIIVDHVCTSDIIS